MQGLYAKDDRALMKLNPNTTPSRLFWGYQQAHRKMYGGRDSQGTQTAKEAVREMDRAGGPHKSLPMSQVSCCYDRRGGYSESCGAAAVGGAVGFALSTRTQKRVCGACACAGWSRTGIHLVASSLKGTQRSPRARPRGRRGAGKSGWRCSLPRPGKRSTQSAALEGVGPEVNALRKHPQPRQQARGKHVPTSLC